MFSKLGSILKLGRKAKNQINIRLLPEILRHIFLLLPPEDLKSAVLVCKMWKEIGEDPYLWRWAMVTVNNDNVENISSLLRTGRLSLIETIVIISCSDTLLQSIINHKGLKNLTILGETKPACDPTPDTFMPDTDPGLLANLLAALQSVSICEVYLTKELLEALMSKLILGSRIRFLELSHMHLLELDDNQKLSSALTSVETLLLHRTYITNEQLTALLTKVLGGTRLSYLSISTDLVMDNNIIKQVKERLGRDNVKIGRCLMSHTIS